MNSEQNFTWYYSFQKWKKGWRNIFETMNKLMKMKVSLVLLCLNKLFRQRLQGDLRLYIRPLSFLPVDLELRFNSTYISRVVFLCDSVWINTTPCAVFLQRCILSLHVTNSGCIYLSQVTSNYFYLNYFALCVQNERGTSQNYWICYYFLLIYILINSQDH